MRRTENYVNHNSKWFRWLQDTVQNRQNVNISLLIPLYNTVSVCHAASVAVDLRLRSRSSRIYCLMIVPVPKFLLSSLVKIIISTS